MVRYQTRQGVLVAQTLVGVFEEILRLKSVPPTMKFSEAYLSE